MRSTTHLWRSIEEGRNFTLFSRPPIASVVGEFALACAGLALAGSPLAARAQTSVVTHSYDNGRTGQNITETVLTPALLSSGGFGKVATLSFDGQVLAQPLYLPSVTIGGVARRTLFVATAHDSVYAVDALTGATLWRASLTDAAHGAAAGATSDPQSDTGCGDISAFPPAAPEWGVSGTPVIDAAAGTLYVVAKTFENGASVQRLHALDVSTGGEKFGGPRTIAASVRGTGVGSVNGVLHFDPRWQLQRAGLLLVNGVVYAGFGAHCDAGPWHGWLLGYDAGTLTQKSAFVATPNGSGGGIWMGGTGISADTVGGVTRLFPVMGNGSFTATAPYGLNTMDYSDDIVRLNVASNGALSLGDMFTPYDQAALSAADNDLGSGGALIPPDQAGAHPHILIQAGKAGTLYVVDRDAMGGYNTTSNKVLQTVNLGQFRQSPTYWNGNVYFWPSQGRLSRFTLSNGVLSSGPVDVSPQSQNAEFGSRAIVSANGNTNGVVWTIDYSAKTQVLYAHDATNVARTLWSSTQNAARDSAGTRQKFAIPVVADGRVFVPSVNNVNVYGLLQADFSLTPSVPQLSLSPGTSGSVQITINTVNGFSSAVGLTVSGLPSGVTATVSNGSVPSSLLVTFTAAPSAPNTASASINLTASGGGVTHSLVFPIAVGAGTFKSPVFGTPSAGGVAFQDPVNLYTPVTSVSLNAGWWIDRIQASTVRGALPAHGGTGGGSYSFSLAAGEYLVRIYGQSSSWNLISQISFASSTGRTFGPYGTAQDGGVKTAFDYTVPAGNVVLGFQGVSDSSVNTLGVIYGAPPVPSAIGATLVPGVNGALVDKFGAVWTFGPNVRNVTDHDLLRNGAATGGWAQKYQIARDGTIWAFVSNATWWAYGTGPYWVQQAGLP